MPANDITKIAAEGMNEHIFPKSFQVLFFQVLPSPTDCVYGGESERESGGRERERERETMKAALPRTIMCKAMGRGDSYLDF